MYDVKKPNVNKISELIFFTKLRWIVCLGEKILSDKFWKIKSKEWNFNPPGFLIRNSSLFLANYIIFYDYLKLTLKSRKYIFLYKVCKTLSIFYQ